jgi:hypothetical protein
LGAGSVTVGIGRLWNGIDTRDNWFTHFLGEHFEIDWSPDPRFLIYSELSPGWARHRGVRIFYTGENVRPDMQRCDWALSFDHLDHERHFRLPLYRFYNEPECLVKALRPRPTAEQLLDRRFCNFVYSNPGARQRIDFFEKLSKYKRVDSGGAVINNIGGRVADKHSFVSGYKFTIAFENSSYPGYTTEKLTEPMLADSLPIYWGNPVVELDFNPASFVNVMSIGSLDDAADAVVELDRNDNAYLAVHEQPWYPDDTPTTYVETDRIVAQFERMFTTPVTPVGTTRAEQTRAARALLRRHHLEMNRPTWRGQGRRDG